MKPSTEKMELKKELSGLVVPASNTVNKAPVSSKLDKANANLKKMHELDQLKKLK